MRDKQQREEEKNDAEIHDQGRRDPKDGDDLMSLAKWREPGS